MRKTRRCEGMYCEGDEEGAPATKEAHPCPYATEVLKDNNPEYCHCCQQCTKGCSNEV